MCSFAVIYLLRTLFVTLYLKLKATILWNDYQLQVKR